MTQLRLGLSHLREYKFNHKLIETNQSSLTETLLFGNSLFHLERNSLIHNAFIDYILCTARFEEPLF